ncbi:Protein SPA, chloroplastic [Cucurbita argyrosperma subsp. argyrosperma]|nr:Protein SPA, chloroplastic [Cucurbita argyrosperma subsp. argyrosperma]
MTVAPSLSRLHSPFLYCPLKPTSSASLSLTFSRNQRSPASYPRIRAIDLDQNTVVALSVGLASLAVGIGIPVFYETQIDNAAKRENTQPCFPCTGSGARKLIHCFKSPSFHEMILGKRCRFCMGTGNVTVELGGDEKEVSRCINCDGVGTLTCTTCQGSGIQPRYLDRREFKDDD